MSKKRKFLVLASFVLILVFLFAGTCLAQQQPQKKFFVISTGGTGGTYYPLGGILAQALSQAVPEVVMTSQAGNASVANCNLIRDKQVESAFVQSNVAYNAYNGIEQFKEKPAKNLRFIASLYPETIQIVARADSKIKTVKDIKGKRLVPGDRGSGTEVDTLNILGVYGYTYKDFANVDWLSFSGGAQRLQDKQTDVTFTTAGWPTAAITELAISTNIVLVPIDEAKIKELTKKYPFYAKIVIPKGTYKGQDKDVATITTMAQWVVGAEVPDDVVYKLTKALWESGAKKMAEAHAQGKNVQPKTALAGLSIPIHPGAEKYYKEKGLIKAEKKTTPKKK
ncbi:MAG TPA: TAXI family TRAP transporter solute-binding subunit [Syntrophales bacterium]|nr:TAXI family TRAP transporter solute-binding subunit [Syntrophales bacterium]HOX94204.1 TAXI family TRAP transporter solute-binding subunit [Syntrophales bacterium]HPI57708.1 TAXI family TRAP transporter solute-binding subunit [Syntrophales bacterium]HPN23941.1 TAXI family TRAP transporter solute-binding subunit [Syntrophales bacterium]HQM28219.1 TAXI family TRAP transporter solute-binding subunit [Syntrophales bacterium]